MRRLLLALMVLALVVPMAIAATATQKLDVQGLRNPVHITVDGTSASVPGADSSGASKRAAVVAFVVSGQAVVALVRVQQAPNGLFVDVIPSDTLGNLSTAAGSMNLATTVPGHPSPQDDAIDAEAIADAGS